MYNKTKGNKNFPSLHRHAFAKWWTQFDASKAEPEQVKLWFKDSNSVSIKHFKDFKDPSLNTHSTIQILKVTQPRQFGSNLNQTKKFYVPFDPIENRLLKAADPETSLFLNQKSQLAALLASSRSKESLAKNLKEVLQLLQQEKDEASSSKKEETNSSEEDDPFYQNKDDCFGISLNDD